MKKCRHEYQEELIQVAGPTLIICASCNQILKTLGSVKGKVLLLNRQ